MPTRSLRRAAARLLPLLLPLMLAVGPLAGCGIDEADLARWKEVREGQERLSGYLASPERPLGLRVRAARYLLEINAGGQIVDFDISQTFCAIDADKFSIFVNLFTGNFTTVWHPKRYHTTFWVLSRA